MEGAYRGEPTEEDSSEADYMESQEDMTFTEGTEIQLSPEGKKIVSPGAKTGDTLANTAGQTANYVDTQEMNHESTSGVTDFSMTSFASSRLNTEEGNSMANPDHSEEQHYQNGRKEVMSCEKIFV